jgi:hypothetical protein
MLRSVACDVRDEARGGRVTRAKWREVFYFGYLKRDGASG